MTTPLTPANQLFLSQGLRNLVSPSSVLTPSQTAGSRLALGVAQRGQIPVQEAAETFFEVLEENYLAELEGRYNGEVRRFPLEDLVTERGRDGFGQSRWIRKFLKDRPERDWTVAEITVDWPDYLPPNPTEDQERNKFVRDLISAMDGTLGNGLRLWVQGETNRTTLRFLPPPLLLGAAHYIYGDQAVLSQLMATMSTLDEVRNLMAENQRPLLLTTERWAGHSYRDLHPYIGAFHDVYHTVRLSNTKRGYRKAIPLIYDALKKVPEDPMESEKKRRIALDTILDGPSKHQGEGFYNYFSGIAGDLESQAAAEAFAEAVERALRKYPHRRRLLEGLRKVFPSA